MAVTAASWHHLFAVRVHEVKCGAANATMLIHTKGTNPIGSLQSFSFAKPPQGEEAKFGFLEGFAEQFPYFCAGLVDWNPAIVVWCAGVCSYHPYWYSKLSCAAMVVLRNYSFSTPSAQPSEVTILLALRPAE